MQRSGFDMYVAVHVRVTMPSRSRGMKLVWILRAVGVVLSLALPSQVLERSVVTSLTETMLSI